MIRALAASRCGVVAGLFLLALTGCRRTPLTQQARTRPNRVSHSRASEEDDALLPSRDAYVGSERCGECHEQKLERWKHDWHSRALASASTSTVVGNFASAHYAGKSNEAWMSTHASTYLMRTRNRQGALSDYAVSWVIGGKRMQDAVTVMPDGRWQVLPVYYHVTGGGAWVDYNEKKQGVVGPDHPFFWTNFRRTANHECLECHTTGLDVRYDRATAKWSTEFADAGVACESCHGPGARHAETEAKSDIVHPRKIGAERSLDLCGSCHGPRDPLYPSLDAQHRFRPGEKYEDHFNPLVIVDGASRSGEYFADGRPSSSSFEYQALLQSRCHIQGGASCLSCHTAPHESHNGPELKPSVRMQAGDASCRSCHETIFAAKEAHTKHRSAAAQSCVACHMPPTLSGVLDHFADHSIDVPNPRNTEQHGVPNACNVCHANEPPRVTAQHLAAMWPKAAARQQRRNRLADAIDEKTAANSASALLEVLYDRSEAPTLRGAAALLLAQRFPERAASSIPPLLDERNVIARARFLEALGFARAVDAREVVAAHLNDAEIQVQQAAAVTLASFGDARGFAQLQRLAGEAGTSSLVRPHLMLAGRAMREARFDDAVRELQAVVQHMPYYSDGLVMLADAEVRRGNRAAAIDDLREALRFTPDHQGARERLAAAQQ